MLNFKLCISTGSKELVNLILKKDIQLQKLDKLKKFQLWFVSRFSEGKEHKLLLSLSQSVIYKHEDIRKFLR